MKKLSNETPVYRILLNKRFFDPDTKEILAEAFKRKYKQKIQGYEKNLSCTLNKESYQKFDSYGVVELSVKDIRELGLDAIQDGSDHVSIINLPHPETDAKKAEDIARKLAKKAKIIKLFTKINKKN